MPTFDVSKLTISKVGIVNDLNFESDFSSKFASMKDLSVIAFSDTNSMKGAIKKKEIVAGVRLVGVSPRQQVKVELFYDNSSLMSSRFFMEIAKAMMQRISSEAIQTQLSKILETMNSLGANIDSELKNISDFKSKLASAEVSLNDLDAKVSAIDFTEIDSTLASQQSNVSDYSRKNNEFKAQVADFKVSFEEMKTELRGINAQLSQEKSNLSLLPGQISFAYSSISDVITQLVDINKLPLDESTHNSLDASIQKLQFVEQKLLDWNSTINRVLFLMDQIGNEQSRLNVSINKADQLFARVDQESASVSSALSSSSTTISEVNQKLSVFKESIDEVKALIADSRKSKVEIESKLDASDKLLGSFSAQMVEFKDFDPSVLARPLVFYEMPMYNVDSFAILVSNSAVIVLILTCMLLTSILALLERNQNVSLRLSLSNTSKLALLLGKVFGQLVIALVEASIIFLIAFFVVGLKLQTTLPELFIATVIISLAFISLGLLISLLTKNQSTAILASLLLIVPMLFLSGVILPPEFMQPAMQLLSSVLPLTLANNVLLGLLVKGLSLLELLPELLMLFGLFVVVVAICMLKKD
jgi:ABC-type multidrug transport system permease subunit/septal ring factor EnvC (AmiA/AmiB activator)